jgi:hypothetical protein
MELWLGWDHAEPYPVKGDAPMAWTWRYEDADGAEVAPDGVPVVESFPTQSDAESWLGETWRELLEGGVAAVTLLEDTREVYGPMPLSAE